MTTTSLPEDTAPLIRVVAVVSALSVGLAAIPLSMIGWNASGAGDAGPRAAAPAPDEIGALASDLTAPASALAAPTVPPVRLPQWIWAAGDIGPEDAVTFRRDVDVPADADRLDLRLSCDNEATVLVDGTEIGTTTEWAEPLAIDLTEHVAEGTEQFTLEVRARNRGGTAGLLATVSFHADDPRRDRLITDPSWRVVRAVATVAAEDAAGSDGESNDQSAIVGTLATPEPAFPIAECGDAPWGDLPGFDRPPIDRRLEVPAGFVAELVYDVPASQGSWVSLAVDGRGRLIASDQSNGLFRITPAPPGAATDETRVEAIDLPVGAAQGLTIVGDDLYAVVAGDRADGPGVYRVRDEDGDDVFDAWERLVTLNAGGEHGPHAIVPGPDGMLYVVAGNYTRLPEPERSLVPRRWDEDHLLPRLWDARGHAVGVTAPGGWIIRLDPVDGSTELFCIGFRNAYDIAFDRHGELFTYDSDMEWDVGAPWYRPTRIVHAVSGADYGWRSGSGKWPVHSPDSLPGTLDIGPGSPTGLAFGYETAFPPRYREALFALDWTFGTVYAIHLEPNGASYTATHEPFLTGRPLPVADVVANPVDGAMYVVVGGRNVRSAIYRIRTERPIDAGPAPDPGPLPEAHLARRALENLHGADGSSEDLDAIWSALGHPDRFVAHAARVALEFRPLDTWLDRLRSESDPDIRLAALIALARHGDPSLQPEAIDMLTGMPYADLSPTARFTWLRAAGLCLIRLGAADADQARRLRELLEPRYPAEDPMETRELCALLVALDSPFVVSRTLTLMERADESSAPPEEWFDRTLLSRNDTYGSVILKVAASTPQQQQMALATSLRAATVGWTPSLRQRYFDWFDSAGRAVGGLSFGGFLAQIREDALDLLPEDQRARWAEPGPLGGLAALPTAVDRPVATGPGRQWTTDELMSTVSGRLTGRDFANGRDMFAAALCSACHRVAGAGGDSGPDLSAVASRFTLRDLLESIVEPSRTISSQYEQTAFFLDDDALVTGRVVDLDETRLRVQPSPLAPDHVVEVLRDRIVAQEPSPVSPMMPHLLDALNEEEVLDLIAYLLAEGDDRHPMFRQAP